MGNGDYTYSDDGVVIYNKITQVFSTDIINLDMDVVLNSIEQYNDIGDGIYMVGRPKPIIPAGSMCRYKDGNSIKISTVDELFNILKQYKKCIVNDINGTAIKFTLDKFMKIKHMYTDVPIYPYIIDDFMQYLVMLYMHVENYEYKAVGYDPLGISDHILLAKKPVDDITAINYITSKYEITNSKLLDYLRVLQKKVADISISRNPLSLAIDTRLSCITLQWFDSPNSRRYALNLEINADKEDSDDLVSDTISADSEAIINYV